MKMLLAPLVLLLVPVGERDDDATPTHLIGYTEGRNDLPGGQFVNWVTNRACVVRADGTGRRVLAEGLTRKEHTWTQFAGWSPDGKTAIIGSHWESPENAAWERRNKTFRMTEGWLSDTCLLDLATGKVVNLTAVERVVAACGRSSTNHPNSSLPKSFGQRYCPSETGDDSGGNVVDRA